MNWMWSLNKIHFMIAKCKDDCCNLHKARTWSRNNCASPTCTFNARSQRRKQFSEMQIQEHFTDLYIAPSIKYFQLVTLADVSRPICTLRSKHADTNDFIYFSETLFRSLFEWRINCCLANRKMKRTAYNWDAPCSH